MKVHVAEQGFEPKPVRAEHGGCTETTSLPSAPDWGLGLLTLQPVLPQEAVLPLFTENVLELSLPLTSSPLRIPQICKSTGAVLGRCGPERSGNFPSFSCFPEPGGRGGGNTPAEGKCRRSGPLRDKGWKHVA